MAGCYCAYRLSREKPESTIDLFEVSDRIGGRLWSVPLDKVSGSPAEIGGMYFGDLQPNLVGLIGDELKLPSESVEWERRHQFLRGEYLNDDSYSNGEDIPFRLDAAEVGKAPIDLLLGALDVIVPGILSLWPLDASTPGKSPEATVAYLRSIVRGKRHLWDWGFWNLLSEILSNEAYNLLLATIGSASMFRNANAYDAIWVFMHEASQNFSKISAGYQSLPEALVDRAGRACRVHMNHRLVRVQRKRKKFRLHFEIGDRVTIVETDEVILAMPRRSLELIAFDDDIVDQDEWRALLDAVIPVPACKLFLVFDSPWWNTSKNGPNVETGSRTAAAYTDLPMRQCYYFGTPRPDEPALLMATYADDVASSFWAGLTHPGYCQIRSPPTPARRGLCTSIEMEDEAQRELGAMHHDCIVPEAVDGLFFDWSADPFGAGWHAWAPYQKSWETTRKMRQPNPLLALYVCGEAFAELQGWAEGAVNNAEVMLQGLGLPRARWIPENYILEHGEEETSMAGKLSNLLVDLAEDLKLQKAYTRNARAVMKKYGLTKAEQDAMLSGDEAGILEAIGPKSGVKLFKIVVRRGPKPAKPAGKVKAKARK